MSDREKMGGALGLVLKPEAKKNQQLLGEVDKNNEALQQILTGRTNISK